MNPSPAAFPPRRFQKRWGITPSRLRLTSTRTSLTQCRTKQQPGCSKESWNGQGRYRNDSRFLWEHSETELWSKLWSNRHFDKEKTLENSMFSGVFGWLCTTTLIQGTIVQSGCSKRVQTGCIGCGCCRLVFRERIVGCTRTGCNFSKQKCPCTRTGCRCTRF